MPNNSMLKQMEIEHELNFGRPEKVIGMIEAQAAQQQDKPAVMGDARPRLRAHPAAQGRKGGDDEIRKWATPARALRQGV